MLVAHEPPLATVLPDREQALAVSEDIHETYERDGLGPAMAKFIAFTSVRGPTPPDFPNHAPHPADAGLPTEDDGSRDHPPRDVVAPPPYPLDGCVARTRRDSRLMYRKRRSRSSSPSNLARYRPTIANHPMRSPMKTRALSSLSTLSSS